jgi:outer membrane protein OmpA-like peptidoglycan-associated protein
MLRQPEKALEIYKEVVKQENVPSEYYLYYAQTLRANGDYEASKKWMKKFKDAGNEQDSRVKSFFKNDDLASAIFNASEKNTLQELNINTEFNEFGAVELNNDIIFSSSRDAGVSVKRLYAWDKQPLLDLYRVSKEGASIEATTQIEGSVNTIHHDGPATFNSDGTKMYFSRNNYYESKKINDAQGIMHVGIYSAELMDGKWGNIKPINLNNPSYIVYHPSLSKDGKQLYFASDMPGTIGGTDIFYVNINRDGSFDKPKNAGYIVNTNKNERFPFINNEGSLFFASDGHPGLGLLDIFGTVSDKNKNIISVINLGIPVNSSKDDFSFFMNDDGLSGFFASNRNGGVGSDDIYAYDRIPQLKVEGTVKDIDGNPVEKALVELFDADGNKIAYLETDSDGYFEINIDRDTDYKLNTQKEGFIENYKPVTSKGIERSVTSIKTDFTLENVNKELPFTELYPIYFDFNKYDIRRESTSELDRIVGLMMNTYPNMVIKIASHTDSRGDSAYNDILSLERANATYKYLVDKGVDPKRIKEYKGFGEQNLVNDCDGSKPCTEDEHQLNRRTQFIVVKME